MSVDLRAHLYRVLVSWVGICERDISTVPCVLIVHMLISANFSDCSSMGVDIGVHLDTCCVHDLVGKTLFVGVYPHMGRNAFMPYVNNIPKEMIIV